ncbi:MAG: Coenzyme F420 hydrogenase/dehydrogenase, beta subunit C-terminal domain [Labrys sp. (in: a-proteobacteria)]
MTGFSIDDVVSGGFCSGCGACAVASNVIAMTETDLGTFVPDLTAASAADKTKADAVCPFSAASPNETVLADERFAATTPGFDQRVGRHSLIGAGAVTDEAVRELSSSGGLTNWLLRRLLDTGLIDGVIHVASTGAAGSGALFSYMITVPGQDMAATRKSRYTATHMAEVLRSIRGDGQRYAIAGVPCFVTAARHLARNDPGYGRQIGFFVGLVCGHIKSTRFAELMAWQLGIAPDDLAEVDFRRKMQDKPANHYHFAARSAQTGEWRSAVAQSLYGGDWGHAFFQLKACDYCDDIFAEGADVALGDAWLPQYVSDWRGTNVVVSRHPVIDEIIADGIRRGEIEWDTLSIDDLCQSQAANFRHRREGLSLRLADAVRRGERVPQKRFAPGSAVLTPDRREIVRLREKTAATSHMAFAEARRTGRLEAFTQQMRPLTDRVADTYRRMRAPTLRSRIGAVLRRIGLR